ncbi:Sorbosone dehydrogenase-domain-containing protein [Catenaria anguillulae PL171]|uniref:Sorbosone dehydrogenase-domain-containing protein n=1 Tax=Catenaria anguillulae PL171 TaxID=765915 RepID=A0A1Y2HKM5_9FUNG|nr:Sorbosone dehydrogenase-domain-containing protein [Catenaria anguillulae PL171]
MTAVTFKCLAILLVSIVLLAGFVAGQRSLEPGFVLVQAWNQLSNPVGTRFAANGRVFVMGKGGVIYTARNVEDRAMKVAADLSSQVFNNFDKGLVGLAPHPNFPVNRHVYLLYARDGEIGGAVPIFNDLCPSGVCFTSGALARMTWDADQEILTNLEEIIVDFCSGSTTHAMGDLRFDAQGNLIFSAGDNTFFSNTLNFGEAPNRCPFGDPADPQSGGVMQSQSPAATSGKLLYIPVAELDAWARGRPAPRMRELARGFRNPYRFAVDPLTNGLYLGDVGFGEWEEINFVPAVSSGQINNYGWPCFEGTMVQQSVQARQFTRCEDLYRGRAVHTRALFQYSHHEPQLGNAVTRAGGASAVTAIGFSSRDGFPTSYRNSLFFADYTRGGFWGVRRNATGLDWSGARMMVDGMDQIVDITEGPDGALARAARRSYHTQCPGRCTSLTVQFSSAGTFDTTGGTLTYAWDLDGSGQFAGPATPTATFTYTRAGPVTVSLRVTSSSAGNPTNVGTVQVFPGASLSGAISLNVNDWAFAIGDAVTFSATIRTETGAIVPAANLNWEVLISHCYPGPECRPNAVNCHQHLVNSYAQTAGATFPAPDHEYPSALTFILRARHPAVTGLVQEFTRVAQPNFVNAQVNTNPPGLDVILNIFTYRAPKVLPTLQNGELALEALTPQMLDRQGYRFSGWSQGGAQSQVIRPVNGTVYTANYERFAIGNYAAGQGPSAPTGLAINPGFRQCTVTWTPGTLADPANPTTGFIVYHREIKVDEPLPAQSSALVPATTTSYRMTVDTGSRCEFQVTAVTRVGESSFRSAVVTALSRHVPPVGVDWCPDTSCRYRTVQVDDFSAGTSPRNMLGLLQEGEFLRRFEVVNGKLEAVATGATTYWYSVMAGTAQCFDSSQFTHLSFKITAQPGWTLNVGLDSKDATCTSFVPKREVPVARYTPEGRFTGVEQTVLIPISDISNSPSGVQSIFFNTMVAEQVYRFDDIFFVNRCNNPPGGGGACTTLPVERFTNADANALGLWTGVEQATRTFANGVMTLRATAATGNYWATLIAGQTCRNITQYGAVRFNIRPASGTAYPNIQLQQRLADCSARDPEGTVTLPLAQFVSNGVATVPLSAFTGANLVRSHALVLSGWPVGVDFTVSNLDLVCTGTGTPTTTSTTATATPTGTPGTCPAPLTMDSFGAAGQNSLGLWAGGEEGTFTYAGGRMTLRATGVGAYFASVVAGVGCRDLSAFTALRFGLTVPAGAALPNLQVQSRNAACTGRDVAVNAAVPITASMIAGGVVTVPFSAFTASVPAGRVHALAFTGWTVGQDYVLSNMQFVCTTSPPPTTTTTAVPTSTATPTATTTPPTGTCTRLTVDNFAAAGEVNALGQWHGGEPAADVVKSVATNSLAITSTAANAASLYFASVMSTTTACRDTSGFSHFQMQLRGPAGGAFNVELQFVAATVASCQSRAGAPLQRATVRVTPAGLSPTLATTVRVPLTGFAGLVPTKVHAYALGGFTAGSFVVSNVQLVSSACPAA